MNWHITADDSGTRDGRFVEIAEVTLGWLRRLLGFEAPLVRSDMYPDVQVIRVSGDAAETASAVEHCIDEWPAPNPNTFSVNYRATFRSEHVPIVDERKYQATLRALYATRRGGYARPSVFLLDAEGERVRVMTVRGEPVGFFGKADERTYRSLIAMLKSQYDVVWCEGWIEPARSGSGTINVSLDLATASECLRRAQAGINTGGTYRRSRVEADR